MTQKKIYNASTGKYYSLRQKTTSKGKKGQILGIFKSKKVSNKVKRKYGNTIKKLGST